MSPRRLWLSTLRFERRECADALRDCWACDYYTDEQFRAEVQAFKDRWRTLFSMAHYRWQHMPESQRWLYESYAEVA